MLIEMRAIDQLVEAQVHVLTSALMGGVIRSLLVKWFYSI